MRDGAVLDGRFARGWLSRVLWGRMPRVVRVADSAAAPSGTIERRLGAGVVLGFPEMHAVSLQTLRRFAKNTAPLIVVVDSDVGSESGVFERRIDALGRAMDGAVAPWIVAVPLRADAGGEGRAHARATLRAAASLGVPVVAQTPLALPPEDAADIAREAGCAAVLMDGSMPLSAVPADARRVFFGSSDLSHGGQHRAVFGKYLRPLAVEWVARFNRSRLGVPLIAAGGVLRRSDVGRFAAAGAAAVVLDAVFSVRPWNSLGILSRSRRAFPPRP